MRELPQAAQMMIMAASRNAPPVNLPPPPPPRVQNLRIHRSLKMKFDAILKTVTDESQMDFLRRERD